MLKRSLLIACAFLLLGGIADAKQKRRSKYRKTPAVAFVSTEQRIQHVKTELRKNGFTEEEIENLFGNQALGVYAPPPAPPGSYRFTSWRDFIAMITTPASVEQGKVFLKENEEALCAAEKEFGVPPEVLIAVMRVETNLGRNVGTHPVANIFYTNLLKGRRWKSAAGHFVALNVYCRRAKLDPFAIRGSWAGAFGLTQFMPVSVLHYSYDGDNDGKIDLFSPADAVASTARFLKEHGWERNHVRALGRYYGSSIGYPAAALAYAEALRQPAPAPETPAVTQQPPP